MPLCCTENTVRSPRLINSDSSSGRTGAESMDFGTQRLPIKPMAYKNTAKKKP